MDKRALKREFKEKKIVRGVFAIRCKTSGQAWIGSGNLEASRTGAWFGLRNGMHLNKAMQAAWNAHGESSFEFDILETFDDDVSQTTLSDLLRDRRKHWQRELAAFQL